MSDTVRTRDQLIAEFPDNLAFEIEAADGRDFIVSAFGWRSVSDPTVNNDSTDTAGIGAFFDVGSRWMNTNAFRSWVCLRGTPGAAVWHLAESSGGTVTVVTATNANGFTWSITNPTTTPNLTLACSVTGIVKGNGTSLAAAVHGTDYYAPGLDVVAIADGGTAATTAAAARTNLGLGTAATHAATDFDTAGAAAAALVSAEAYTDAAIAGTQPLNATLTALAATSWAANAVPIGTGAGTLSQTSFAANTFPARASSGNLVAKAISDLGLTLVSEATASGMRGDMGLGTAAVQNTGTSGGNVPLLNAANTWSANQTFPNSSGVLIQDVAGTHTIGLILGETLSANRTFTLIVNNASLTVNLGGNVTTGGAVTFSGAFALTIVLSATTNVTFPTSGTLLTTTGDGSGLTGITAAQVGAPSVDEATGTGTTTSSTFVTIFDRTTTPPAGLHGSFTVKNTGASNTLKFQVTVTDMYGGAQTSTVQTLGPGQNFGLGVDALVNNIGLTKVPPYQEVKLEVAENVNTQHTTYTWYRSFIS